MLEIQKWLKEHNDLDLLNSRYGIINNRNEDGRVILNYHQIESHKHKYNPLVRECRGLVLDSKDWSLVGRSFNRFFNLRENEEEDKRFDWSSFTVQEKLDGSHIMISYWGNSWHLTTRNSFGDGLVPSQIMTWKDLFTKAVPENIWDNLNKNLTYIFELCSQHNKVVRTYNKTEAYLLTIFKVEEELSVGEVDKEAQRLGLNRPSIYTFSSTTEISDYLDNLEDDPTFEGFVVRDKNNNRLKIKSRRYLDLHKIVGNGNVALPKNLIRFVLDGETDELLTHFEELKPLVEKLKSKVKTIEKEIDNYWFVFSELKCQKKFAMAVKDQPFSHYLFRARKECCCPIKLFRNDPEGALKVIEKY